MSAIAKFGICKDAVGKFRFRLKAPNGEIIATGEVYASKDGCQKRSESVWTRAAKTQIACMQRHG